MKFGSFLWRFENPNLRFSFANIKSLTHPPKIRETKSLGPTLRALCEHEKPLSRPNIFLNKKAAMGEGILNIYRLILVSVIALVVLLLSSVFYDYYIDVKDIEARVMAREVVNCVAPDGVLDLSRFNGKESRLLEVCGFSDGEVNRFYVSVQVEDDKMKKIKKLEQGDSGIEWIRALFASDPRLTGSRLEKVRDYRAGYYGLVYDVVVEDGDRINGKIEVGVIVT